MPLSLNEVYTRAASFARDWADACDDDAEAKCFCDILLNPLKIGLKARDY